MVGSAEPCPAATVLGIGEGASRSSAVFGCVAKGGRKSVDFRRPDTDWVKRDGEGKDGKADSGETSG